MQKVREMQNLKWSEDAIQQAIIFEQQFKLKEAIECYQTAVELDNLSKKGFAGKGILEMKIGDYQAAEESLK